MVAFSQQRLGFVECALRVELMARRLACLKGASHIFDGNRWQTINRFDIDTRFFFFFLAPVCLLAEKLKRKGAENGMHDSNWTDSVSLCTWRYEIQQYVFFFLCCTLMSHDRIMFRS